MTAINPITALLGMLDADFNGMLERECNKSKYRAADRQAAFREKEQQRKDEYNRTHFGEGA